MRWLKALQCWFCWTHRSRATNHNTRDPQRTGTSVPEWTPLCSCTQCMVLRVLLRSHSLSLSFLCLLDLTGHHWGSACHLIWCSCWLSASINLVCRFFEPLSFCYVRACCVHVIWFIIRMINVNILSYSDTLRSSRQRGIVESVSSPLRTSWTIISDV